MDRILVIVAIAAIAIVPIAILPGVLGPHTGPQQGLGEDLISAASRCLSGEPRPRAELFSPGPVGYRISSGAKEPGSRVGVWLDVPSPPRGASIWFLVLDADTWPPALLYNESRAMEQGRLYMEWTLPGRPGSKYLLLAAAIGPGGEVLDYVCSVVEVPPPSAAVEMVTDKPSYRPGDTVRLVILNKGSSTLVSGSMYTVYRWSGSGWEVSGLTPGKWTLEAIILEPGGYYVQEIVLDDAPPGLYRVVKEFIAEGVNARIEAEAVFRVEP